MYCWNCGTKNEDGARFCCKCGADLREEEIEGRPRKKSILPILLLCLLIIILIVGAQILHMFLSGREEKTVGNSEITSEAVADIDEEPWDDQIPSNASGDISEETEKESNSKNQKFYDKTSGNLKEQSDSDDILPDSSSRILTDSEVKNLTKDQLRLARNEIYARHGRRFDDVELQDYFNSKSWYSGTIAPDDFTEEMLSEIEKKNIELIKKYE